MEEYNNDNNNNNDNDNFNDDDDDNNSNDDNNNNIDNDKKSNNLITIIAKIINKICHNSRAGNDIDMKLGLVTKLGKRSTATSKIFDVCSQHITIFSMVDLEQSRTEIPDAWSLIHQ